jgi:hypothetical protein
MLFQRASQLHARTYLKNELVWDQLPCRHQLLHLQDNKIRQQV